MGWDRGKTVLRWLLAPALLLTLQAPLAGLAQSEPTDPVTLYASGLYNPRGMTWDEEGVLYVAQAGTGNPDTAVGQASGVVRIVAGCAQPVASGFPSTGGMGSIQGPGSVAFLDGKLYILQDSSDGRGDLRASFPNGVYTLDEQGAIQQVADISAWMDANPTREIPADRGKLGETFAMMTGNGFLWVVEANEGQILTVTPDGTISRHVDLSEGHPVWTSIAPSPDGGIYVANLTESPYPDGEAKVLKVDPDGTTTTVWTGLTMVVSLVAGPDGALYALEMSTENTDTPPHSRPGGGRIVKQTGANSLVEVVTGFDFPIAMSMGPDGALYVSSPAAAFDGAAGTIIRVDPTSEFLTVPTDLYESGDCPGYQDALTAFRGVETSISATESVPSPTPQPSSAATDAVPVTIKNFAFDPPTVNVKPGQSVEWTNEDAIPHTATAADDKPFNSGNLNQNQQFTFTFNDDGTIDYTCIYHPYMHGTIVVNP